MADQHSSQILMPHPKINQNQSKNQDLINKEHEFISKFFDSYQDNQRNQKNYEIFNDKISELLYSRYLINDQEKDQLHEQCCVCADCIYTRNLVKPSQNLFNLTMNSIYQRSFKNNQKNSHLINTKLVDKFNGKIVNLKRSSISPERQITNQTVYKKDLAQKVRPSKRKLSKVLDTLKFQGPFQTTTSYNSEFTGICGQNPYVKKTSQLVPNKLPLDTKTTNSMYYRGQLSQRTKLQRSPDLIKLGLPLLYKQSTSQNFYRPSPNPQRQLDKRNEQNETGFWNKKHNPFETVYGESFDYKIVKNKGRKTRSLLKQI